MANLLNRVYVTTATTGTGTVVLGAALTGYGTFANMLAVDGSDYSYVITDGVDFEIGVGTYNSGANSFSRDTVTRSKIGNTFGTSKLNLSGNAFLFCDARAQDIITEIAAGFGISIDNSDPQIPQVLQINFTSSQISSITIPAPIVIFQTTSYSGAGDGGGAQFIRASGSTIGGFQSLDGQWWKLAPAQPINPIQFGADPSAVALSTVAIQNAVDFLATNGGGLCTLPEGTFRTDAAILVPTNVSVSGLNPAACAITGNGTHPIIELTGLYSVVSNIRCSGGSIGVYCAGAGRYCVVHDCVLSYNRIGVEWNEGYINTVERNKIIFNSYGMIIRGQSYEFNILGNVIDNNTGGLGIALFGSPGVNIFGNTIEGNRILSTRQGVGLAVYGFPQRVNIGWNWFEQNGTPYLADGTTPNPYSVDIILGDGVSTVGAEIASTCIPSEYQAAASATISFTGQINIENNFHYASLYGLIVRCQSTLGKIVYQGNRINTIATPATIPVQIIYVSGLSENALIFKDNAAFTSSGTAWTPAGIGGSYVYCTALTPLNAVKLEGVDLYTKQMTCAQFAAISGATLACDARLPSSGNASLYRDYRLVQGTSGVRTTIGTGRVRMGASAVFTIGQTDHVVVLSSPGASFSYVNAIGTAQIITTVSGAPNLFSVSQLVAPTSTEGTFFSGQYYGYAVMTQATYDSVFAGARRLQITDFDVIKVNDVVAAKPSSTQQVCSVGDVFYYTTPASGGYIGCVCTTAGTPGTISDWGLIT